jgi:hypothetical protein
MTAPIGLIGDSFGTRRGHGTDVDVPDDATWPQQVRRALSPLVVDVDFRPFRKLTECPDLLATRLDSPLAIVQAGIVDCYPRPLSQDWSRSPHLVCKIVRRAIRPVRREWVNYVARTTWSSRAELVVAVEAMLRQSPTRQVGFVTAAPVLREHAAETPGAQEAIFEFNDLLRETVGRFANGFVIDLHSALLAAGHRRLLSPHDSHLNQAGNDWFAAEVLRAIAVHLPGSAAPTALKVAA